MTKKPESLPELSIELARYSDRACAIVAGSILDLLLENLLRKNMLPDITNDLFTNYGPLSSFGAKIDVTRSLALISLSERADLHRIRKIRNEFAHSIEELHFSQSPIRDHISQFHYLTSSILGEERTPRTNFVNCVAMLSGFLKSRIDKAKHPSELDDLLPILASISKDRDKSKND